MKIAEVVLLLATAGMMVLNDAQLFRVRWYRRKRRTAIAAAQSSPQRSERPIRCEDTQSYCEGCDELVVSPLMAFTDDGDYRCLMCRGIELTPMVLQGVAPGKRHTFDGLCSCPSCGALRAHMQKCLDNQKAQQAQVQAQQRWPVLKSVDSPAQIIGSLDFLGHQPDTVPGLTLNIDELVHQTIRGLWGIPGPMVGSHVDAGQSLPWGSVDARSGPDWEPDPDKNPHAARALSLCRAIEEVPRYERHKMVDALDKHLMEWPQDAEVVAKLIDPRLLQDDEQGWGDMPKS